MLHHLLFHLDALGDVVKGHHHAALVRGPGGVHRRDRDVDDETPAAAVGHDQTEDAGLGRVALALDPTRHVEGEDVAEPASHGLRARQAVDLFQRVIPGQDAAGGVEQEQADGAALENRGLQGVQSPYLVRALAHLANQPCRLDRRGRMRRERAQQRAVLRGQGLVGALALGDGEHGAQPVFDLHREEVTSPPETRYTALVERHGRLLFQPADHRPVEFDRLRVRRRSERLEPVRARADQHRRVRHAQRIADAGPQPAEQRGQIGLCVQLARPVE